MREHVILTPAAAETIARDFYDLSASARLLPGEFDLNFHLRAAGGREYVLKLMRPGGADELVDLQIAALDHLAAADPDLTLPRVVPNRDGDRRFTLQFDDGERRCVWLLTYIPGPLLAGARPQPPALLQSLGQLVGRVDAALRDFSHPAAARDLMWDLTKAGWIAGDLHLVAEPARRELIQYFLDLYESEAVPRLPHLPRGVIHGDANDYNVVVDGPRQVERRAVALLDLGDMHVGPAAADLAVAAAYALLDKEDPLAALAAVTRGYHAARPLGEEEIAVLFPLTAMRLCVSVVVSARRRLERPDDPYAVISERPAWEALARLRAIHPRFAHYTLRQACGLPPVAQGAAVVEWLRRDPTRYASLLSCDLRTAPAVVFDLSVGSQMLGADPAAVETGRLTRTLFGRMKEAGDTIGVGRYDEARLIYTEPIFFAGGHPTAPRRTIHLGLDLFDRAGAGVYAPLDGIVHTVANNSGPQDYGPVAILEHRAGGDIPFYTLYGHLGLELAENRRVGDRVKKGEKFATIGAPPQNGDWPPHLHFQIILDLLDLDRDFPGVAPAAERAVWLALSPDPNLIAGIPDDRFPAPEPSREETLAGRRRLLGPNLSLSYREPLKIVRGWMQYLYDETGRTYLDVYNNVPHVGHSHPRVVAAVQAQAGLLNTNTRYLHDNPVRYAERLTALLPEPLRVCYFVNSASEANELALRLARAHTGREAMVVMEAAYHGHTTGLIDISPYKFDGPGGQGARPWVHVAPIPDDYRGPFKRSDPEAGRKYAAQVAEIIQNPRLREQGLAGWICESLPSVGGQIVLPTGYLAGVYRAVRAAGGVCIADEVQVGFGRLGHTFWGFESQGVVPDIVVLGKPIGNGHPLGAVVTTAAIAASFDNGMEFFSTFGGSPVACAAGLAVLDVLEEEKLQAHAREVGDYLLEGLRGLAHHPLVGDVRGRGLFLGVELVRDRRTLEPAAAEAAYAVNRLRERGILVGTDGPLHNVLKIRPPMPFNRADADRLVAALDAILGEDFMLIDVD